MSGHYGHSIPRRGAAPSDHRTWRKVREEGCCRICGISRDPRMHDPPKNGWVTGHHLVPKSQGGSDNDSNIVPLCFYCHKIVDSLKPVNADRRAVLRSELRVRLTDLEVRYCNRTMGVRWLDRNYPLKEAA